MGPQIKPFTVDIDYIINEEGNKVKTAPHPRELIKIPVNRTVKPYYLVRRKR